jgi:hypothetical protein
MATGIRTEGGSILRAIGRGVAVYCVTFLPLNCALALVEGTAYGMWGWDGSSLRYQAGAWFVYAAPPLLVMAFPAAALHALTLRRAARRWPAHATRLRVALAPPAFAVASLVLGPAAVAVLTFPAAFALSALAFGAASRGRDGLRQVDGAPAI